MSYGFSMALKSQKEMAKQLRTRMDVWIQNERRYDDDGIYDGKRMWPKRSTEQLEDEYNTYVKPADWEQIKERQMAWDYPKMVIGMEYVAMMQRAKLEVAEKLGLNSTQNYFITIRPDETKCSFAEFHTYIQKFVSRACFLSYHLAFEQKGLTPETLGRGFHAHIVAHMKQRSKGEVLRDTCRTFEKIAAANCIDVQCAQRPEGNINKYLKHISDDGHKEATAEPDALWRKQLALEEIYTDLNPIRALRQPIKSSRLSSFSITEVADAST